MYTNMYAIDKRLKASSPISDEPNIERIHIVHLHIIFIAIAGRVACVFIQRSTLAPVHALQEHNTKKARNKHEEHIKSAKYNKQ